MSQCSPEDPGFCGKFSHGGEEGGGGEGEGSVIWQAELVYVPSIFSLVSFVSLFHRPRASVFDERPKRANGERRRHRICSALTGSPSPLGLPTLDLVSKGLASGV